jgi:predicted HD phosphohydrolase
MQDKMTMPETVSFHQMDEGTEDDYALLHKQEQNFITTLPSRIVSALENLEHSLSGYQVSRLEHSLQTATRAEQGELIKNSSLQLLFMILVMI